MIAYSLDRNRILGNLQKLVPDLKEIIKLGMIMTKHSKGEIENSVNEGWEAIESLANKDHPKAMYIMGKRYLSKNEDEKGLTLMKMAADKGDGDACLQLGLIYRQGSDFVNAFKWIKKAHEAKKVEGTFYLGSLYHQGHHHAGGTPDLQKASEYYDQAARKGLAIAQFNLGVMHMSGIPERGKLVKNVHMAIEYWKMAAVNGVDLACMNLAALYINGLDQEEGQRYIDKELALTYLESIRDKKRFQDEIDSLKQKLLS